MGDGLLLHRAGCDHALQLCGLDGLHLHRGVDGARQDLFNPGFADGRSKASELRGVTGQAGLVVLLPREILPDDVLAPARHERFVAQVLRVLRVQQG